MTAAERISAESVELEVIQFDARDRAVVAGQVVIDFTQVGVIVSLLSPREWEEVAEYLFALAEREPLKSGRDHVAHRTVIGAVAGELRGYAHAAGEPTGSLADLRAASTRADERRILARLADQDAALERHVDDVIADHHAQTATLADSEPEPEEEPTSPPPAAPAPETTDATTWLL